MTKPPNQRTVPPQQTCPELKGIKSSLTAKVNIQCGFVLKLIHYMIHLGGASVEVPTSMVNNALFFSVFVFYLM